MPPRGGRRRRGADAASRPAPERGARDLRRRAPLPAQRVASFVGSMPAIAGAERMQMRFDLQRRRARRAALARGARRRRASASGRRPMPGRAGFVFHKRVDGLQVPRRPTARSCASAGTRADGDDRPPRAPPHAPPAASPTCVPTSRPARCARRSTCGRRSPSTRSSCATTGAPPRGRSPCASPAARQRGRAASRPAQQADVTVIAPRLRAGIDRRRARRRRPAHRRGRRAQRAAARAVRSPR